MDNFIKIIFDFEMQAKLFRSFRDNFFLSTADLEIVTILKLERFRRIQAATCLPSFLFPLVSAWLFAT